MELNPLKWFNKAPRRQAMISFDKTSKGYVMTVQSFTNIDDVVETEYSVKDLVEDRVEFGYYID